MAMWYGLRAIVAAWMTERAIQLKKAWSQGAARAGGYGALNFRHFAIMQKYFFTYLLIGH